MYHICFTPYFSSSPACGAIFVGIIKIMTHDVDRGPHVPAV